MSELVDKIRAAIDEDEQLAQEAWQENWRWYPEDKGVVTSDSSYRYIGIRADSEHIARHDPTRVLRQVAAYRAILAAVELYLDPHPGIACTNEDDEWTHCELHVAAKGRIDPNVLPLLAEIYGIEVGDE